MYTLNERTINCKLVEYIPPPTQNIKTLDFVYLYSFDSTDKHVNIKPCM